MEEFNSLAISLTVAALIICLSNIVFTQTQGRMGKKQNRIFMMLLVIVAFNSVCNTLTAFFTPFAETSDSARHIAELARYNYHAFHAALAPLFFFYTARVCGVSLKAKPQVKVMLTSVFIFTEILVLSNPLTHFVYYTDENFDYYPIFMFISSCERLDDLKETEKKIENDTIIYSDYDGDDGLKNLEQITHLL